MKTSLPAISEPFVDSDGRITKSWFDKLKFLEKLQPLSDIPAAPATVDSIDGATGAFTLGYGLSRSSQQLLAGLSSASAALGADVALNNTANYFDGPSVALGQGTWFVTATVTVVETTSAGFFVKLWDGTTVISSLSYSIPALATTAVSLSGIITNPAGNVKVSVRDTTATSGSIKFNTSGNSKDSTISAVRIA